MGHDGFANSSFVHSIDNAMSPAGNRPSPDNSVPYICINNHDENDRFGTSSTSAGLELVRLNVALCECSARLPSLAKSGMGPTDVADDGSYESGKAKLLVIDEVFRLTTDFMSVIRCPLFAECEAHATWSSMDPKHIGTESAASQVADREQFSRAGQSATETGIGSLCKYFSHSDEATLFTVVACHCRLTEIYISIFQMMQACLQFKLVPQPDENWAVVLPQLQIGSLASPPVHVDINTALSPASASMYMLIITTLSSQLWEQLADTMRTARGASMGLVSVSECALANTMWNTVADRTDQVRQTIDTTKHLLQQYSNITV